jgi:hypothetical protein
VGETIEPFLAAAGPWAVLMTVIMTVVMAMIRGLLIPWKTHEREIAIRDRMIADANKRADYFQGKYDGVVADLLGLTEAVADRATQVILTRQATGRVASPLKRPEDT